MAQYSQLEASQNSNDLLTTMNSKIDDMNSNFVSQMALTNTGQAVSLVGKSVHVETKDTSGNVTADVTGTVTEVKFVSGVAMLVINGTQYSLSDVQEVSAAS
jgi:flagellar hook assembly protein FlgD